LLQFFPFLCERACFYYLFAKQRVLLATFKLKLNKMTHISVENCTASWFASVWFGWVGWLWVLTGLRLLQFGLVRVCLRQRLGSPVRRENLTMCVVQCAKVANESVLYTLNAVKSGDAEGDWKSFKL